MKILAWHIAHVGEMKCAYKTLGKNLKERVHLEDLDGEGG
jgi:hypothetical protein